MHKSYTFVVMATIQSFLYVSDDISRDKFYCFHADNSFSAALIHKKKKQQSFLPSYETTHLTQNTLTKNLKIIQIHNIML